MTNQCHGLRKKSISKIPSVVKLQDNTDENSFKLLDHLLCYEAVVPATKEGNLWRCYRGLPLS
jgi:hypothetical protein